MKTRNHPPKIAILLLILLVCLFVCLRLFPHFSSSIFLPEQEVSTESRADTTAPVIRCDLKSKTITAGTVLSVEKLGIRVTDNSPIDSVLFTRLASTQFYPGPSNEKTDAMKKAYETGINIDVEELQFSYGGIYELTVTATDIYANSSDFTFTLKVETPPIFEAPNVFYVCENAEIPYDKYVSAWDVIDGAYAFEDIVLDASEVHPGKTGTYPVSFSITDSYGLRSEQHANVHVLSAEDLQNLIDTHKINISDHTIIGASKPYDIGLYSDAESLQTAILPALVHISNDRNDRSGDGIIIHIDEDFVTIAATESLVLDNLSVQLSFVDNTTCSASVVFTNTEYDLAFIRVPIDGVSSGSSLSSDALPSLRTVHLDETQWKNHPATNQISLKQLLRHYELVFKYKLDE